MRCLRIVLAVAMSVGCTKSECINEDGCDTAAEVDPGPTGPVEVIFNWVTPVALEVEVSGLRTGVFGVAETGLGGTGYYGEDCVSPLAICHTVQEGANTFLSQHQNATGVPWDGLLEEGETALHQDTEENLTYAVWTVDGDGLLDECVAVFGHDVEFYAPHDCVNL